jgi:hypothetical protein
MKRDNEEERIHMAVVQHIRALKRPGAVVFHVPNAGKVPVQYRTKLYKLGLLPGVSDLIGLVNGEAFALELKREANGRVSEKQNEFLSDWRNAGGHGVVAEGLDEALACIKAWGWVR